MSERKTVGESPQHNYHQVSLLREVAVHLLTAREPASMTRGVFDLLEPHFELDAFFNYLVNDAGDALVLESCAGIPEDVALGIKHLNFGEAICGLVALHREPRLVTEIQYSEEPAVQLVRGLGIRAYACSPLMIDGRLLGTLSFASRLRDQFQDSEFEFFQTVAHYVTAAFHRLKLLQELQEVDRRKDIFLATLAHELRNPLAPISNVIGLMGMDSPDSEQFEELRQVMAVQVHHMTRLIEDLMDVSRITRGVIELRKERISLRTAVDGALDRFQLEPLETRPLLEVSVIDDDLCVEADPTRLAQILSNLLNNAFKYTPVDGRVWLEVRRQDSQAEIIVRDTGVGIPQEKLAQVFEMFVQVGDISYGGKPGLGIGLTLVKSLVEMHGGTVEARSDGPGQGSEIIVRLPLASVEAAMANADGKLPAPGLTESLRTLVVDDSKVGADIFAKLLMAMGHEAQTVTQAEEALRIIRTYLPQIVFCDICMPGLNGYELAGEIRQRPEFNQVVLVAVTGYGQPEDKRRAIAAGFDFHITKPVQPSDLEEVFQAARARNFPGRVGQVQ
jgi:signal transduction histidine kinase/CheY-like chemotaxis protein